MSDLPVHCLVIDEAKHSQDERSGLVSGTLSVLEAARGLKPSHITLFTPGQSEAQVTQILTDHPADAFTDVSNVLCLDACDDQAHTLPENLAMWVVQYVRAMAEESKPVTHILGAANTFGKNLLPRVAALLDVGMLSDLIKIIDANTFVRPIYAGNAWLTVSSKAHPAAIKVMSVRTTAFTQSPPSATAAAASATPPPAIVTETVTLPDNKPYVRFVKRALTPREHAELTSARIVISGGRGLKSAETFKQLERIADRLGAAVGATRAAVDAGLAPNDYQVGQTGKLVAPALYIAVGISGAIQHIAGMSESKIIVVINRDPDAPLFEIADYGLIGDLFEILPRLETLLLDITGEK